MRVGKYCSWGLTFGIAFTLGALLAACGGGDSDDGPRPSISITQPTSAPSYYTTDTGVILGGTISGAGYVHVRNIFTGFTTEGYVNYYQGQGSWWADVRGLVPGDNAITATADADGTGARTASATITVRRPLQPANLIINGATQGSTNTFWTDMNSFNLSHKIALFEDGTGRSTTGNVISENAGPVTDLTWSKPSPDSILISNCPTCSFQKITRISGSLSEGAFYGQVETVGGADTIIVHFFSLASGNL